MPFSDDSSATTPSALERAYRALILWDEERMQPRVAQRIGEFEARIGDLPRRPPEAFQAAARGETLQIALWFQENEEAFLREAVSYLPDEVLNGLAQEGLDRAFTEVILDALNDTREELTQRMFELREAAGANAPAGDSEA
jgi:hypothetical protein